MPGMTFNNYEKSGGRWAGDFGTRDSYIPGGITLLASAFPVGDYPNGTIPSGTLVGRTAAERTADTAFGPWTAGDAEVYLTFDTVGNVVDQPNVSAYRPGRIVYPLYLPAASLVTAAAAVIEQLYIVNKGRS